MAIGSIVQSDVSADGRQVRLRRGNGGYRDPSIARRVQLTTQLRRVMREKKVRQKSRTGIPVKRRLSPGDPDGLFAEWVRGRVKGNRWHPLHPLLTWNPMSGWLRADRRSDVVQAHTHHEPGVDSGRLRS
jgi:hypothetical protein